MCTAPTLEAFYGVKMHAAPARSVWENCIFQTEFDGFLILGDGNLMLEWCVLEICWNEMECRNINMCSQTVEHRQDLKLLTSWLS